MTDGPQKHQDLEPVSMGEIEAEDATALPDKEVMSLLDINANVDLGLDLAAPVDLAVAANLNVAAPIEAAAAANVLSTDAEAAAVSQQAGTINQAISGSAEATAPQDTSIDQTGDGETPPPALPGEAAPADAPTSGAEVDVPIPPVPPVPTDPAGDAVDSLLKNGSLLNADVNINADADITAPINGAVAANANVAAPINAAVGANIGSDGSVAQALADQQVNINQSLDDVSAEATAEQNADIEQ
jgi:hypothetical protein